VAYAVPVAEIRAAAAQGYFFMKVKIGQPGTQQQMLEKDKARLTEIHEALAAVETPTRGTGSCPTTSTPTAATRARTRSSVRRTVTRTTGTGRR
jgi:hypothetical protein